ncbi:hypothetical protein HSACCH_02432 [Halanaerobium saccharolyticum subsp. saccharolyticum DSM 6643]|uniref:AAA+ ATPase domain-containing protein n=1 Tax=Halanaerobium saccharolyticum subsp. saccharolyticum DSM 6643 TaxID=1293054 RepID=M5E4N0_9FIRM|nr:metallophosphoesterase [Halanaerobium saccharolyticum]CCU80930.1 hypothetical protein HSACCH_02432 [Halanaerobium saccharolyticum subsp. saccharolyticum DSM 6643]
MKILMIHLSDIHLKKENDFIIKKSDKIISAVQNVCLEYDDIFLVITGDISFSGKLDQYLIAYDFIMDIKNDLEEYTGNSIKIIVIPGNHDCDYDNSDGKIRDIILDSISGNSKKDNKIDEGLIDNCCQVQEDWFDFYNSISNKEKIIHNHKLLQISEVKYDDYNILFYQYNTSWFSRKNEQYGNLYFPYDYFGEELFDKKADLVISFLHHPLNWQLNNNGFSFKKHLEKNSDIILTGHEHTPEQIERNDLSGKSTGYIHGNVLQSHDNDDNSGFNLITFDLDEEKYKTQKIVFDDDIYTRKGSNSEWNSFKKYKKNRKGHFKINDKFKDDWLNDPGATFVHSNKNNLILEDIFVWPDLELDKNDEESNYEESIFDGKLLIENKEGARKLFLIGEESSGKTTLCKMIFKKYFNFGFTPIYFDASNIKSEKYEDFQKLLLKRFKEQYNSKELEKFSQLKNNKKVIIIDDFHDNKLAPEFKKKFFNMLAKCFSNIIITTNSLFKIEEILEDDGLEMEHFTRYNIKEFGHLKRENLIKKWHKIGQERFLEKDNLIRKLDKSSKLFNRIIGSNYIPSYPIYLLTILQTEQAGNPHRLKESTYGHYYSFLITNSLGQINIQPEDLDFYYNYLSELSYFMFKNEIKILTKEKFKNEFHNYFCDEYSISMSFNEIKNNLIKSSLIEEFNNSFKIKYKYVYYFFIGNYLSNNISNKDIKTLTQELCSDINLEENANIIMFLTHHSKDPFIINELLNNAKELFKEYQLLEFNTDIESINGLLGKLPEMIYKEVDVIEHREDEARKKDKAEFNNKKVKEKDEESNELFELNLAFKNIEILGQILKNYYGSMKGKQKYDLVKEVFDLSLRTLNFLFEQLATSKDYFVKSINKKAEKNNLKEKDEIRKMIGNFLFHFAEFISYFVIKKVSNSVGNQKLNETFAEVAEEFDYISVELINVSIKLDYYQGFPFEDVKKLYNEVENNLLPKSLLKRFIINYFYMFDDLDYKQKQKIFDLLNIPIKTSHFIANKSTQKKLL